MYEYSNELIHISGFANLIFGSIIIFIFFISLVTKGALNCELWCIREVFFCVMRVMRI